LTLDSHNLHTDPPLRNISDTALWVAVYRAMETDRKDALFRDPFARRLAGERGARIAESIPPGSRHNWAWTTRTILFDEFVTRRVSEGCDRVVNLAAGLDMRPYRMPLPATLTWIEVDLPDLLDYKESLIGSEAPACRVERVRFDLARRDGRRELFERAVGDARNATVVSEGLLIYLTREEVGSLADDLAATPGIRHWILDVTSPGLLKMLQRNIGTPLSAAQAPLKFGPEEGPGFFEPHGWRPVDVGSFLKTAARIRRLSPIMHLLSFLPESKGKQGNRPWSAVCLMEKKPR
jgi:methyltransferase (TIGR00027 family)